MTRACEPDADAGFMRIALMMARRGLGCTAPNPSVGAVLVDPATNEVLARASTRPGGRPHAETEALRLAGDRTRGATLYVSLEPCAHQGQTPPCADAIIQAGIGRVVSAISDPNPLVAGQGLARLRAAGIQVVEGVGAGEARWITLGHILRVSGRRPFVQLKLAVSADGRIAAGTGQPVWVTGPEARARGHLLRAQSDAILVGIGTVRADDPELTRRLPGLEARSPPRVVLDRRLRLPLGSKLARSARATPVLVIADAEAPADARNALEPLGVIVLDAESAGGGELLAIDRVLQLLAGRSITRLLVEGGPHVWRSFLDAGLVDEVVVFQGAAPVGEAGRLPLLDRGLDEFSDRAIWRLTEDRPVGADRLRVLRHTRHCPSASAP